MNSPAVDSTGPSEASERQRDQTTNRSPVTMLATASARRWPITLAVWVAVIAVGLTAYFGGLAREGFPPVNLPIAIVDGPYFVDNLETVDSDVAVPLSEAFGDIEGVAEVQSFALANAFAIVVEFEDSFSSPEGAALLEAALPSVDLPAEADVSVRSIDATKFLEVYDVLVSVAGPDGATAAELEAEAEKIRTSSSRTPPSPRPTSATC